MKLFIMYLSSFSWYITFHTFSEFLSRTMSSYFMCNRCSTVPTNVQHVGTKGIRIPYKSYCSPTKRRRHKIHKQQKQRNDKLVCTDWHSASTE